MSSDIRNGIYNNLNQKSTEELVEMWQTNDQVEWSALAFEIVQEILQERLGEVPPQDAPVLEHVQDELQDEENLPDDEALKKITSDDNPPVLYNPGEVLWLDRWLKRAAIAAVVVSVVVNLFQVPTLQRVIYSFSLGNPAWNSMAWLLAIVVFIFSAALQSIVYYFSLKALGVILKILMEMEFNSRQG